MLAWLCTTDHPRGCNTPAVARQFVYTAGMIARSSLLTVCLLALPPLFSAPAGALAATPANAGRVSRLLAVSDSAYAALDLARAHATAAAAVARDSTSGAAAWRLARVLLEQSDDATDNGPRRRLIAAAVGQARRAARFDPDAPWGHVYTAIAAGKLALLEGGRAKIRLGGEVRDAARRALARDPRNDLALDVLGQWHREVATLSPVLRLAARIMYGGVPAGASLDSSAVLLAQAVALAPQRIRHRVELGATDLELVRYPAAIAAFDTALALPRRDPGDVRLQARASQLRERARRLLSRPQRDVSR